jgi:hypothetical protein
VIADPEPNTITRPYRGLSVQEVDIPLTPAEIEALLRSREIYRRTAFLALRAGPATALVAVRPEHPDRLFSPVAELRVLSGPATTVWIDEPAADVGNASSLAATALAHQRDGALAYLVKGRFEHVNFIWRPAPLTVHVTEVIPPHPPKLLAMAEQVVGYDEDLPPLTLVLDAVDVRELMAAHPAPHYLLPCRGSGAASGHGDVSASGDVSGSGAVSGSGDGLPGTRAASDGDVSFLDCHPPERPDWLLIGCDRSRQFHQHFYGSEPRRVELCPKLRSVGAPGARVLTKCCLLERGIQVDGATAVVPWGANLDEVRAALRALCGLPPPGNVQSAGDVRPAGDVQSAGNVQSAGRVEAAAP